MENLQLSPSLSVPCEHSWLWYDSVHNLLPASFTCGFTWGFPEEAHHVHTELFGTRLHACFYPRRTIAQLLWALRIRSLVLRSTAKMRQHALRSWPGKKGRQVTGFFPGLSHCVENYSCDRMQRKISSAENRSKGFFFSIAVCSLLHIDAVTLLGLRNLWPSEIKVTACDDWLWVTYRTAAERTYWLPILLPIKNLGYIQSVSRFSRFAIVWRQCTCSYQNYAKM